MDLSNYAFVEGGKKRKKNWNYEAKYQQNLISKILYNFSISKLNYHDAYCQIYLD